MSAKQWPRGTPAKPLFIALEGGEGVGKSTQAKLLSGWMTGRGVDHVLAREPGGSEAGEAIRDLVLGRVGLRMAPLTELFLILASRSEFVSEVARPVLRSGRFLLADRFSLSTLAYQGYGRGIDLETVRAALAIATDGVEPDLYLVIDLPGEAVRARARAGGGDVDRIENAGDSFMSSVRRGYRELAAATPGAVLIDGGGTREEVHRAIRETVRKRMESSQHAATGGNISG